MTHPTFTARFLTDGSTALQCRETATRYIVTPSWGGGGRFHRGDCATYRNGEMIRTGPRAVCINAIESDARWTIRNAS